MPTSKSPIGTRALHLWRNHTLHISVPLRIVGLGHGLFALAGAGLALLSLAYRDFAPMWHAIPAGFPWREIWVCGCGLIVLAASAGLCFSRTALASVLTIGTYLAVWAVTRAATVVFNPLTVGSWYGFCEALTPVLGAWILYIMLRGQLRAPGAPLIASERALRAAQALFGFNCAVYGLAHFAYADYTAGMVPAWLPSRLGFAYFTGLGHFAAGIGMMVGIVPRLAATLEAIMMSSFGLLVWVPSLFARPPPKWAMPPQNQWSELVLSLLLAASAWILATSLRTRPWGWDSRRFRENV
jgi:uncharacterized membrane protein